MQREELESLCNKLSAAAGGLAVEKRWPSQQIQWLKEAGVFRAFIPREFGGDELAASEILELYLELSQACMTTTFVLTQWNAACKRIQGSENESLKRELLPKLAEGSLFATVGISHLTTSRQHVAKPVLRASETAEGFVLDGASPWVTGGAHADVIVVGAVLDDGRQILAAVDRKSAGLKPHPGSELIALSSSCTDRVELDAVSIPRSQVLAGPIHDVLQSQAGGGAGGLQTSTLAIGLSMGAAKYLETEAEKREELKPVAAKLSNDCESLRQILLAASEHKDASIPTGELRQRANSLVLRSTQAALSAAKGAGFLASHPAGRWATEAMFFLVWSCPQPVVNANMCELAQL